MLFKIPPIQAIENVLLVNKYYCCMEIKKFCDFIGDFVNL